VDGGPQPSHGTRTRPLGAVQGPLEVPPHHPPTLPRTDVRHVVWDWNGTLFDDFDANVAAVAEVCDAAGGPVVTAELYRRHFVRPVSVFYERLLGRPLEPGEWDGLNAGYFSAYRRRLASLGLVPGAEEALAAVAASGRSQSLLSMWEHEELVRLVRRFGIEQHFLRVDGQRGTGGDSKEAFLAQHVGRVEAVLGPLTPGEVLVVGDSVDDARAATALGLGCVLVSGGPEDPEAPHGTGVPVVASVADAVGALTARR
jgi:phosphoglycolate phosphatase-like HAD superfamily hydrolase